MPISGCGEFSAGDGKGVQIGTGEHGVQTIFVFRQSAIHGFLIAELTLDDPKCVLYLTAQSTGSDILKTASPLCAVR